MCRTACTEPQCLYKGDLYLYLNLFELHNTTCFCEIRFKILKNSGSNSKYFECDLPYRPRTQSSLHQSLDKPFKDETQTALFKDPVRTAL